MSDREQQIAELREEFWDLQFEAPKPKPPALVTQQTQRMTEIEAELQKLGSDVGERPKDFPTRFG